MLPLSSRPDLFPLLALSPRCSFFFQAEDGIRDTSVTGVQTCALPICSRVLITAGPTYEDLDPVRYVGNRSSGRMGFAIAEEATRRGADVTLVAGPTTVEAPPVRELVRSEERRVGKEGGTWGWGAEVQK